MNRPPAPFAFALLAAMALFDCRHKAKAGDACAEEGKFVCADPTTRLVCTDGKFSLERCASCEQTSSSGFGTTSSFESFSGCVRGGVGPEGSACSGESFDCTADGKEEVRCEGAAYKHYPCRGKGGCTHALSGVVCDDDQALAGDACHGEGAACTTDSKGMLECEKGVFVLATACGGPEGCTVTSDKVHCDTTVSKVGDPCRAGAGCSADKSEVIGCVDGKFAVNSVCRGADPACEIDHASNKARCKEMWAQDGDPCTGTEVACTVDGHTFLQCKDGKYGFRAKCKSCKNNDPSPGEVSCYR